MTSVECVIAARNREWILPKWLESLENQTHRLSSIVVLDNSCPTEVVQSELLDALESDDRIDVVSLPSFPWEAWERGKYTKENFAYITNAAFQEFLRGHSEWLFFFDTDQECGPDAIERLLALDVPAAGLVIRTNPHPAIMNFLGVADPGQPNGIVYDRNSLKRRSDIFKPYPKFAPDGPFEVGFVSGAVLLHRSVVERVEASPTHPNWEWGSVWDTYHRLFGRGPVIEPRVWTKHHMTKGEPPLEWNPQ